MVFRPGKVGLLGSGEMTTVGGLMFEKLVSDLPIPLSIGILETPAGFELNSDRVAGRVGDYMQVRLQNYQPQIHIIPARMRNTEYSTERPEILKPLLESSFLYMGAGSPSYAVRQLSDSLAWYWILSNHRTGGSLGLTSAAAIAAGEWALPVYEIYKVGEEPYWKRGLNFFAAFGLRLVILPHWNNSDGGTELDTSRCFMGRKRFDVLLNQLPDEFTLLGLDEQTALLMDLDMGVGEVFGKGSVTVLRDGVEKQYPNGCSLSLDQLGNFSPLYDLSQGIPEPVWQQFVNARQALLVEQPLPEIPLVIQSLVEKRQEARQQTDWEEADRLRQQIFKMGWLIVDTREGPKLEPVKNHPV